MTRRWGRSGRCRDSAGAIPEAVGEAVRRAIRAALSATWNKKPTCHVHVLEV